MKQPTPSGHGRYAKILMDHWFKRAFGASNERTMRLFLQEIIPERTIETLTYAPQEHTNPFVDKKDNRVDVECIDASGSRFVVEMQLAPQRSFYDRAVFNSTFAILQQRDKGEGDEYFFPTVYMIGLMDFSFHADSDQVLFRYRLREDSTGEVMTDHIQFIFLELLNCRNAFTPKATALDNLCYVLHNIQDMEKIPDGVDSELISLLFNSADIRTFTPEEKARYDYDMTTERDIRNQISFAMAEGRAEGKAEGKAETQQAIARRMLSEGLSADLVSRMTGLAQEQVRLLM